ncbi:MAG: mannosyl-3-phosphoglycerate phosphatase [Nitrospirae bacterium CG22_combo_CG10-13_8_21_14_all_44_11]|nr:MAG: mannosyl-3-phosphoglycerate phosphatase [Nitrospirae bacterium CG22_combo_CG10-13_8_21_14_all_44_11]
MKKPIIFTDLDGTLLDYSNYSFEKALPALQLLKDRDVPLVICSSKTKKEIEYYRKKLDNHHPFVSENGGGIFIPKNYSKFKIQNSKFQIEKTTHYYVIRLGVSYADLRKTIIELRKEGFSVKGFGDMTAHELAENAHMTIEEAEMAKKRDFDEPFIYSGPSHKLPQLLKAIKKKGFKFTQGRFFHILGSSNKGIAVSILINLYKNKYKKIETIALGDSPNDIPMLVRVDYPVIVQKHDGSYDSKIKIPCSIKANGIGPDGWNKAVLNKIL